MPGLWCLSRATSVSTRRREPATSLPGVTGAPVIPQYRPGATGRPEATRRSVCSIRSLWTGEAATHEAPLPHLRRCVDAKRVVRVLVPDYLAAPYADIARVNFSHERTDYAQPAGRLVTRA
jgi:hypothetical protein